MATGTSKLIVSGMISTTSGGHLRSPRFFAVTRVGLEAEPAEPGGAPGTGEAESGRLRGPWPWPWPFCRGVPTDAVRPERHSETRTARAARALAEQTRAIYRYVQIGEWSGTSRHPPPLSSPFCHDGQKRRRVRTQRSKTFRRRCEQERFVWQPNEKRSERRK